MTKPAPNETRCRSQRLVPLRLGFGVGVDRYRLSVPLTACTAFLQRSDKGLPQVVPPQVGCAACGTEVCSLCSTALAMCRHNRPPPPLPR